MEHHNITMHGSKRLNSESIEQRPPCICETLFNNITDRVEFVKKIYQMLSSKINFNTSFHNHLNSADDVDKLDLNMILTDDVTRVIYNRGVRDGSKMVYKKNFKSKKTSKEVCALEQNNGINQNLYIDPQSPHTTQCIAENIDPQLIAENRVRIESREAYDVPKTLTNVPNNPLQHHQFSIYENIDSVYLPLPAMQLMMDTELLNLKLKSSVDTDKNEHAALIPLSFENNIKKKYFKDKHCNTTAKNHLLSTPYVIDKKKNNRKVYKKNSFTNERVKQNESSPIIPLSVIHYMDKLGSDQSTSSSVVI